MSVNMKTKTIILALLAMIFVCGQTRAQDDLSYRSFKSFKNDTIQYLDYNFLIRGEQYAGKKVSDLINDLELPILSITVTMEQSTGPSDSKITGIELLVKKMIHWSNYNYQIGITFANPIPCRNFKVTGVKDDSENYIIPWTTKIYEQIRDRELKTVTANSYLIEERRKLLETHTKEGYEQVKKVVETERANWRNKIRAEKQAETKKQD